MCPLPTSPRSRRLWSPASAYAALMLILSAGAAAAQSNLPVAPEKLWLDGQPVGGANDAMYDEAVKQMQCLSCMRPTPSEITLAPCCDGCNSGQCKPGRKKCDFGYNDTGFGRTVGGIYAALCCTDPCYEPMWIPEANAALFAESPRPVAHTRFRFDRAINMSLPDRNEFFKARTGGGGGKGPRRIDRSLDYSEISYYQEIAGGPNFATGIATPYRRIDPDVNAASSNFADLFITSKTVLLDSQLFLLTLTFNTHVPVGNFAKGIGTGHVSLEPGFLYAVRMTETSYIQGQVSQWIPIGGDNAYAGAVLHTHTSFNRRLAKTEGFLLIGTMELNSYTFQDGSYSDPILGPNQKSSGETYLSIGPGIRAQFCDNFDIGFGAAWSLTDRNWAQQFYRTEVRIRY